MRKGTSSIVAIKRMSLESSIEGFPLSALNEIKFLRRLDHQNILRLIDVGIAKYSPSERLYDLSTKSGQTSFTYPWNFFMICEYAEHSLAGLLERGVKFSPPQIKSIFKQVLEGLTYLHSQGIMHRDIKCSNILVNSSGIAKLADFGISTQFKPMSLQNGKKTVATLWYRAPEVLMGQNYSEAIDIWGLGCVLAELILGKPLFMGRDGHSQLIAINKELSIKQPSLWEKLADV